MPKPLKTEFVIVDGGRARWVRRSETADDFVTHREMKAAPVPPDQSHGVVFESSTGQRFNVEERSAVLAQRKTRFAETVAEEVSAATARGEVSRLVVVAPARMLKAIGDKLSAPAKTRLARTLAKDLTKTPDHELGRWLRPLEQG